MKSKEYIEINGAKAHNLKNVGLSIPRNEFVVVTGLSGSSYKYVWNYSETN